MQIYIAAAQLEEAQQESVEQIPKIVRRMVKHIGGSRDTYLQEALKCEQQGSLMVAEIII